MRVRLNRSENQYFSKKTIIKWDIINLRIKNENICLKSEFYILFAVQTIFNDDWWSCTLQSYIMMSCFECLCFNQNIMCHQMNQRIRNFIFGIFRIRKRSWWELNYWWIRNFIFRMFRIRKMLVNKLINCA